ncbi:MAG TPA: RuBisCO large subunit C-terminal-like domain-containing protein [Methylocella sp.]|nr:RuBisCO large subunit C-terminal-like domain-containing protein [Methylocella sp.]
MDGTDKNIRVFYKVRGDASSIEERAKGIAIEQSVETPLAAIRDPGILADIVGKVVSITDRRDGWFNVEIELCAETVGEDPGQLLNMLFGNASLYEDVILEEAILPASLLRVFEGPRHGINGFFRRLGGDRRALTCSALKPQGLHPEALAKLAYHLALGGLDYVKDDHGIANQSYSPFAQRVPACAAAVRKAAASSGSVTRYVPNLSGHQRQIEDQIAIARAEGLDTVMIAPMLAGVSAFWALRQANPDFMFIAHPAMTGAVRVTPCLFAKLFRLFGADAVIFPNPGGRFTYSEECCGKIVEALRGPVDGLLASLPVPAGGMSLARVPELLAYYGQEAMLLIGGALLSVPPERIAEETAVFVRAVADYRHG